MSKFPKLPVLKNKVDIKICVVMAISNDDSVFLVTKNFFSDFPVLRKYKKIGWACRYAGINKSDFMAKRFT